RFNRGSRRVVVKLKSWKNRSPINSLFVGCKEEVSNGYFFVLWWIFLRYQLFYRSIQPRRFCRSMSEKCSN
ncbi:hypothetical protein LINPERHAP1_LOCUS20810, partial [Linum perenne]